MTIKIRHLFAITLCAVVLCAVAGCSAVRKGTATERSSATVANESDMRVELSTLLSRYGDWKRLRVPMTVNLRQPKSVSIGGTAVMERGKSIMMSLKFFGMEIGYLYMTNDTVIVVDKVHKYYAAESVGAFLDGFDASVSNVQDVLLGRVFMLGQATPDAGSFRGAEYDNINGESWMLIPKGAADAVSYGFRFSPADVLSALIVQAGVHQPVIFEYALPSVTRYGVMSPGISAEYVSGKTSIEASIEWELDKARWDSDVEIRQPDITSKYRRIPSADIPKILSGL